MCLFGAAVRRSRTSSILFYMDEAEEKYEYYSKYVPKISDTMLNNFQNEIIKTIEDIFYHQKISIVLPMIYSNKYPESILNIPKIDFLNILMKRNVSTNIAHPTQIQYIAAFFDFIYQNPLKLVNALIHQYHKADDKNYYLF